VEAAQSRVGGKRVAAIRDDEQVAEPERVIGVDGKLYPARHDWGPGNGNRPAA
jgi:hypothetical protein